MFQSLITQSKSRREYLTKLYDSLNAAVYGYIGATVTGRNGWLNVRVHKETMDLKRFQKLQFTSQYLCKKDDGNLIKLTDVPLDSSASGLLLQTVSPITHDYQVRFRKGEKNDKDLFIEVWRDQERGFISSLKVSDKVTKVYNDAIFGGVSWSKDERKIVFIGEKPEPASYKNYWEDPKPAEKKKEEGE